MVDEVIDLLNTVILSDIGHFFWFSLRAGTAELLKSCWGVDLHFWKRLYVLSLPSWNGLHWSTCWTRTGSFWQELMNAKTNEKESIEEIVFDLRLNLGRLNRSAMISLSSSPGDLGWQDRSPRCSQGVLLHNKGQSMDRWISYELYMVYIMEIIDMMISWSVHQCIWSNINRFIWFHQLSKWCQAQVFYANFKRCISCASLARCHWWRRRGSSRTQRTPCPRTLTFCALANWVFWILESRVEVFMAVEGKPTMKVVNLRNYTGDTWRCHFTRHRRLGSSSKRVFPRKVVAQQPQLAYQYGTIPHTPQISRLFLKTLSICFGSFDFPFNPSERNQP